MTRENPYNSSYKSTSHLSPFPVANFQVDFNLVRNYNSLDMKNTSLVGLIVVLLFFSSGCVPDKYKFTGEFGKPGSGKGEFLSGTDMAINKDGDLIICDAGNSRFQIVSSDDGSPKLVAGEHGTTGYKVQGISGIGVNPLTSDIWLCDLRGNKLVKFDKRGNPIAKAVDKMKYPLDCAVDRMGNVYVIMSKQPALYKYDAQGAFMETIGGTAKAALIYATSIVIYEDYIYVADFGGKKVIKLSLKGEFIREFDKKGVGKYDEEMKGPSSIFVDNSGNLLILDLGDIPILILSPDGEIISRIGTYGNEKGQFLYPRGIVEKPSGEIIVLDNSRNVALTFKKLVQ